MIWIVAVLGTRALALSRLCLLALLLCLVLPPLSGCAWLADKQSTLALRPTTGRPAGLLPDAQLFRPQDERFTLPQARPDKSLPDQVALWWLPHADPQAPTLLYLHGTFFNLYRNLPKINALREAGFAILAVDYRGWGDSTPTVPTEATINADALLAWAELQRRQPVPGRRVIFGHSMGTAVAVTLASSLRHGDDYAALALEAAFTRMPDIAAEAGFLGRVAAALTTLEFNSLAKIGRVDAPILMLHGDADRTVPIVLGRRLRDAAPPGVRWVEVPGGSHSWMHRDTPEIYQRAFAELIQTARLKP